MTRVPKDRETSSAYKLRGKHAALTRHRGKNDPATIEAAEDLAEARIRKIVDALPPLSDERRARLVMLLLRPASTTRSVQPMADTS